MRSPLPKVVQFNNLDRFYVDPFPPPSDTEACLTIGCLAIAAVLLSTS
jgi:hypothetical protein